MQAKVNISQTLKIAKMQQKNHLFSNSHEVACVSLNITYLYSNFAPNVVEHFYYFNFIILGFQILMQSSISTVWTLSNKNVNG